MDFIKRLNMKGLRLNNESLWIPVTITSAEEKEGADLGYLQEEESKKLGLNDRSFSGDVGDSLDRSIAAKRFEIALRRWGGGTAQVIGINQFHDFPDVGQANARFTFNTGYGMIITNRDQDYVPMILGTGKSPHFLLMGWHYPAWVKQIVYMAHKKKCESCRAQVRCADCETEFGFLQEMKDHEVCQLNMQMLMPMKSFNKELLK